ncbi:MAG TPA: Do family serine endopeptidase [Nevskia sp.]|nr:Do family serine endopeptidase [Nevskia sp.]
MTLNRTTLTLGAAALLGVGAAGGWAVPTFARAQALGATTLAAAAQPAPKTPIALGSAPNYRAIVDQNRDAVVSVTIVGEARRTAMDDQDNPFANDPFFRRFFGFGGGFPQPQQRTPIRGLGSGFIVSPDGVILTNAHVVDGADHVTVHLADRREFKAKVLGKDKTTDIAVLKIDARDLPTVRLGDSDKLGVGDYVLAIGAPYGLEESASAGIVSAKGRSLPDDSAVPFIQTDVAVNPGNSGGPLFDSTGAVVGINSQIYSNTGGYQGVSFAIPIDVALNVKDQVLARGKVEHARLGVNVQTVDQSLADSFGLKAPGGALVSRVEPDSAAAKAGLKSGDIILKCDGEPINDAGQLSSRIGLSRPGETVKLDIWRDRKAQTIEARLGDRTDVASADDGGKAAHAGKLGLTVRGLTRDEREQAGVDAGVLVQDVSGPAAAAGIQPGDVVLSVNGKSVSSGEQVRQALDGHGDEVALLIQRGDTRIFVPVDLG